MKVKASDNRRKESKKGSRLFSLIGHRIYIRRAQQNGSFDGPDSFGAADFDLFTVRRLLTGAQCCQCR
jgi:hypothetical protein